MAWLTTPALIGPVLGPPLGGLLVTYADWRWIFIINVPIGVLGIILVTLYVEDIREPRPGRLDWVGLILSGRGALRRHLRRGDARARRGAGLGDRRAASRSALVAGWAYIRHARARPDPLLDLSLLRIPTFAVSVLAGTLFRTGVGAIPFLLPMMFQLGFGDTPAQSGMITFASAIGAVAMKPAAQGALRLFGFRATLFWNAAASAIGVGMCAAFRAWWPIAAVYAVLIFAGFLRSLQFTAYNTIAYADIPRARMSAATSLYSTIQQLSLTFGVTIGAAVLAVASGFSRPFAPRTLGLLDRVPGRRRNDAAGRAGLAADAGERGAEMSGHRHH